MLTFCKPRANTSSNRMEITISSHMVRWGYHVFVTYVITIDCNRAQWRCDYSCSVALNELHAVWDTTDGTRTRLVSVQFTSFVCMRIRYIERGARVRKDRTRCSVS